LHVLLYFVFVGPVTLMLHNVMHRGWLKPRWKALETFVCLVPGALLGHTPNSYRMHHLWVHHREKNMEKDLSSTIRFQRDSVVDFARYYAGFVLVDPFKLGRFLVQNGFKRQALVYAGSEALYWALTGALALSHPGFVLAVFWAPVFLTRTLMVTGNWAQHAFINPERPAHPMGNSLTVTSRFYNAWCFNDGYHAAHHARASLQFSELRKHFESTRGEYARHDAIVLSGVDYHVVWLALMLKRHRFLARAMVDLGPAKRTLEEKIEVLKARLRPLRGVA
jgi:hypothetical protein